MRGLAGAEKRIDIPRTGKAFAISFLQPAPGKMMAQSFQSLGEQMLPLDAFCHTEAVCSSSSLSMKTSVQNSAFFETLSAKPSN
jgi:hypothetical protein